MHTNYLVAAVVVIVGAGCITLSKQKEAPRSDPQPRQNRLANVTRGSAATRVWVEEYKQALQVVQQGQTALDHKRYTEAENLFRKAVQIHAKTPEASLLLADVSERQGKLEQALQAYYTLVYSQDGGSSIGTDPVTRMRYVLALVRSNRYEDAVQVYDLARQQADISRDEVLFPLRFDANTPDENHLQAAAHYVMGIEPPLHRENVPGELRQHLDAAIRLAPDWGKPHAALGKMLEWHRHVQEAEVEYTKSRNLGEPVESYKQKYARIEADMLRKSYELHPEHRGVNGVVIPLKLNGEQIRQLIAKSQADVLKSVQQQEAAKKAKEEAKPKL